MKKKTYITPMTFWVNMPCSAILVGTKKETFIFDPSDETSESLIKEQRNFDVWDNEW